MKIKIKIIMSKSKRLNSLVYLKITIKYTIGYCHKKGKNVLCLEIKLKKASF